VGRLRYFREVPAQSDSQSPSPPVNWSVPFALAGFPMESLHDVKPKWTPPDFSDARRAWEGRIDGREIRVEAAAYKGRVHYFEIVLPWDTPSREQPRDIIAEEPVVEGIVIGIVITGLVRSEEHTSELQSRGHLVCRL